MFVIKSEPNYYNNIVSINTVPTYKNRYTLDENREKIINSGACFVSTYRNSLEFLQEVTSKYLFYAFLTITNCKFGNKLYLPPLIINNPGSAYYTFSYYIGIVLS